MDANLGFSTTTDRFAAIRPYVRQGTVLDVGCVDARTSKETSAARLERKPNLLFTQIAKENAGVLGVDIDAPGVARLRELGHNARHADAQTMDLGARFDTIVAGELIEHLENPGGFLRNMLRHLRPSGTLILTTPNAFAARTIRKIWRYGQPSVHAEHTCWFDPITLGQLLRRCGFAPAAGYWLDAPGLRVRGWPRAFRRYFAHSFLIAARPA